MAKALLARTLADAGTITAGNAEADFPVTNLLDRQPSKIWRTTSLSNTYFEIDLASATSINFVYLGYTNLTESATWQVRGATSQANLTASPGYNSGAVSFWPQTGLDDWDFTSAFIDLIDSAQSYRWWRVDLSDGSNPAAYVEAGRLMLGGAFRFEKNLKFDNGVQWLPARPDSARALSGAQYVEVGNVYRKVDFRVENWTQTAAFRDLFDLQRRNGIAEPVVYVRDSAATTEIMEHLIYGTFSELGRMENPYLSRWGMPVEIVEDR